MPSPYRRGYDDTPRLTESGHIPAIPMAAGRRASPAEAQRRYRAGHRAPGQGQFDPVWDEPRNGLPVRLYVYRGSGADAYTGEVVEL